MEKYKKDILKIAKLAKKMEEYIVTKGLSSDSEIIKGYEKKLDALTVKLADNVCRDFIDVWHYIIKNIDHSNITYNLITNISRNITVTGFATQLIYCAPLLENWEIRGWPTFLSNLDDQMTKTFKKIKQGEHNHKD